MAKRIPPGSIINYSSRLDRFRSYHTDNVTPQKIAALMKNADSGDIGATCELQEEMESKSPQIHGIFSTRRGAFTGLNWDIVPATTTEEESLAVEAADYCREILIGSASFRDALRWMSQAIGPNIAMVDVIWESLKPVGFMGIPGERLSQDLNKSPAILIETDEFPLGVEPSQYKVITHIPDKRSFFPQRVTLTRSIAWLYVIMHYATADWSTFAELFGQPWRIAKFKGDEPDDKVKASVIDMLQNIGHDGWGAFAGEVDIELLEAAKSVGPHKDLIDFCTSSVAILVLGQTLTTDIGDVGSRAAAQVHDNVRTDKLMSDIEDEATTIREQLLRPMCEFQFPGRDVPIPEFKRLVESRKDVDAARLRLEQLRYARESGLRMEPAEVYEALGLTMPEQDTDETDDKTSVTFNELTLAIERATKIGDLDLVNALRRRISKIIGENLPDLSELGAPTDGPTVPTNVAVGNAEPGEPDDESVTARAKVLNVIAKSWRTVKDIASRTGLTHKQVRGVVQHSKSDFYVQSRRVGKSCLYRAKPHIEHS